MVAYQQITAQAAYQIVADWLFDKVSYMLTPGELQLVVGGMTVVWRAPATFSATHLCEVGAVGAVDVDGQTDDSADKLYYNPVDTSENEACL